MKTHCCWVCLLLFELVLSSPLFDIAQNERASIDQDSEPWVSPGHLVRSKRQSSASSILGDIFQIPISTLTAVSQLFNTAKKQRDKRRPYQNNNNYNNNDDDDDNDGGYSTYNNGQTAKPYNSNSNNNNYNNNGYSNSYNNNKFGGGQTAYNNGYNAYNNGNNRPSYNGNNIGSNAFNKPSSSNNNNYNGNMFNRPFHYLSQFMNGFGNGIGANNRASRTHGAMISGLTTAADGSEFKI